MIFIMRAGQRHGPYSREELLAAVQDGSISLTDEAWHDGAAEILTVSDLLAAPSAPATPITSPISTETGPSPSSAETDAPSVPTIPVLPGDEAVYFVSPDGEATEGPYSLRQLRDLWDAGKVSRTAQCWSEEAGEWRPLKELVTVSLLRPPTGEVPPPLVRISPVVEPPTASLTADAPRPWSRFFARYLDTQIFGILIILGCAHFSINVYLDNIRFLEIVPLSLGLCEALFLAVVATTPGKWLLGLRVTHSDGGHLSVVMALRRFISVAWRCTILTFPFCGPLAWRDLRRDGATAWDRAYDSNVTNRPRSIPFVLLAVLLTLATGYYWFAVGSVVARDLKEGLALEWAHRFSPGAPSAPPAAPPADPHDPGPAPSKPSAAASAAATAPASVMPPPAPASNPANPAPSSNPTQAVAGITNRASPFLVVVEGDAFAGSGAIINIKGKPWIVTNAHVPSGNRTVTLKLLDATVVEPIMLNVASDRDLLLAGQNQVAGGLEASTSVDKEVSIGDEVVVLGNSLGKSVVTELTGKVLGIGPDLIEVDAPFVHGNSGSPIIHLKTGKVIGIATYVIPRHLDATTADTRFKEVRRLGVRIDTVPKWYPLSPEAYLKEGLYIAQIQKRSDELALLAIELHQTHHVTPLRYDPSGWVSPYAHIMAKGRPKPEDHAYSIDLLKFGQQEAAFKTEMNNDIANVSVDNFTPYHRGEFEREVKERLPITNYLRSVYWDNLEEPPAAR